MLKMYKDDLMYIDLNINCEQKYHFSNFSTKLNNFLANVQKVIDMKNVWYKESNLTVSNSLLDKEP